MKISLATILKKWRATYGHSQISAAHFFGVPLRTWEGWERSTTPLSGLQQVLYSIASL